MMNNTNDNQPNTTYSWDPVTGQPVAPNAAPPMPNPMNQAAASAPQTPPPFIPNQPVPPTYGVPQGTATSAPNTNYEAPNQDFAANQNNYGMPNQEFAANQNNYGMPNQEFAANQNNYGMPNQEFTANQNNYGAPQPGMNQSFNYQYSGTMNQTPAPKKSTALSMWCMILGIIAIITSCLILGGFFGCISIILGIISLAKKENKPGRVIAGFITSLISIAIVICMLVYINSDTFKNDFMEGYKIGYGASLPTSVEPSADSNETVSADENSSEVSLATDDINFETEETEVIEVTEETEVDPVNQALLENTSVVYSRTASDYVLLIVNNNNDQAISCDMEVVYLDADGNIIGTDTDYIYNCAPKSSCALFTFPPTDDDYNDISYDHCTIDYWIGTAEEEHPNYGNDLEFDLTPDKYGDLQATITNNSEADTISSLYCTCIFLKDDVIVDFSSIFISDLKESATDTFYAPTDYDDYKIIINEAY